ncbi:hypothetical protein VITFI_CDS0949 [Vitreoscilla filiformis]|uniref:Uncharacterized protein n=1 Tax=Vitreoscilla filiformis TaxID=63 RepID=A0A221KD13_VITFI|nr:hypothetical protein VITFI_CDS0949 [Vitreoscilla filiformis]
MPGRWAMRWRHVANPRGAPAGRTEETGKKEAAQRRGAEEEGREEEDRPRVPPEPVRRRLRSFDKTAPGVAFLEPGQVPEHLNPTHARLTGGRCIGSMTSLLNL